MPNRQAKPNSLRILILERGFLLSKMALCCDSGFGCGNYLEKRLFGVISPVVTATRYAALRVNLSGAN